jgi:hypothetical protein
MQASGQDNSTAECHTPPGEGGSCQGGGSGGSSGPRAHGTRSAAQSPRRGHRGAGPGSGPAQKLKPANVLTTLLSPVLTLLHAGGSAKPQEQQQQPQQELQQAQQQQPAGAAPDSGSSVLLEVRGGAPATCSVTGGVLCTEQAGVLILPGLRSRGQGMASPLARLPCCMLGFLYASDLVVSRSSAP